MNNSIQTDALDWRRLLTAAERRVMLADIARVSLAVGAVLVPSQPWSDLPVSPGSTTTLKPPLEQLSAIEHLLPTLTQAVRQIMRSPLTAATTMTRLAQPEQARRVMSGSWMAYARQPHRQTLDESVTLLSHDTLENQAVKSFLAALKRDCRAVALLADAEDEAEAASRARRCTRQLEQMSAGVWWDEVSTKSASWAASATTREILRPDYACVSRLRRLYRKEFRFDWDCPLLTLPPRETWRIYEVWCFFTVYQALTALGWEPTPPFEGLTVRSGRLTLALATGEKARIVLRRTSGRTLSLTYNQAFAEGRESLSHTMQPDIALSDGKRVWILDAKFKPYARPGEEGDDINQMHGYRDAIVGGDGVRSAVFAWCLYAGESGKANRSQITYGRGPDTPVGALCLRPGDRETFTHLRELLSRWLV